MIAAICFGAAFGLPFIVWGVILILDRDRSWQRYLRRYHGETPQRKPAWDRRQIIYGTLLVIFGATILLLFSAFNYLAQTVSPSAPF